MARFAQYLLKRKVIVESQLDEALQHQVVYGARLGTNLVELRMITVEQLADCLADFHRIPLPPKGWLERPRRAAIERVTRPLVERIRFIPLRLESNILHVAVLDPNDPRTLDDLRFATGCKIQPYVLPEIWMHDWLLTLFKVPRGIRHVETDPLANGVIEPVHAFDFQAAQAAIAAKAARIMVPATVGVVVPTDPRPGGDAGSARKTLPGAERVSRVGEDRVSTIGVDRVSVPDMKSAAPGKPSISAASTASASVRPPPVSIRSLADLGGGRTSHAGTQQAGSLALNSQSAELHPDWGADTGRIDPLPPAPEAIRNTFQPAPSKAPSAVSVPPIKELSELELALMQVTDREQLLELSFAIASRFARVVALFSVQHGMIQGVRCVDAGEVRLINGVLVPLESTSMLTHAVNQLVPFRVDPRERPLDARLQRLVSDQPASEVSLFPVTVKQRVVNLLYASHGTEPLGAIAFGAIALLAEQMGGAYGQLILHRKGGNST